MSKISATVETPSSIPTNHEIEVKYLVDVLPENIPLDQYKCIEITQGYLTVEPEYEQRVRKKVTNGSETFFKTEKKGVGKVRKEREWPIDQSEFDSEMKHVVGNPIIKRRYLMDDILPGLTIELDVYRDSLEGLITAEIELSGEEEVVQTPSWFRTDVTEDERYSNKNLALHGIPDVDEH